MKTLVKIDVRGAGTYCQTFDFQFPITNKIEFRHIGYHFLVKSSHFIVTEQVMRLICEPQIDVDSKILTSDLEMVGFKKID